MWNVAVYHTDEVIQTTATAFARNHSVTISGNKPNGVTPVIEYKATSESAWKTVDAKDIELKATTYTTTIGGLTESTDFTTLIFNITSPEEIRKRSIISTLPE
jgi:hypothetical protein